ncbi:hypothetical protein OS493_003256 [Desmophyllum pertusum]|uniref:Uncharacterized protein n=1 Tax=Desmophyllum pertusum TaxID=174260 RepID=A0A9W9YGT0_9CNID|nr:hypothetical protein OS493_003256 [Desmophyllum pertusum]
MAPDNARERKPHDTQPNLKKKPEQSSTEAERVKTWYKRMIISSINRQEREWKDKQMNLADILNLISPILELGQELGKLAEHSLT